MADTGIVLNALEQQPFLHNLYTQISFCYPVPDPSSRPSIVNTLTKGLERLSASVSWLAGQVIKDGSNFKIVPLDSVPRLVVKDLGDELPFDDFRKAKFPFRMLDEAVIAPRPTLGSPPSEPAPVFLVQVNFVVGGLVLTILGQHNTMDMTGQGHIIALFSKACRGEEFTPEEISVANLAREDIIPLLDDNYTPGEELSCQIVGASDAPPAPPAPASWAYFSFSASQISELKSLATKTLPSGFISSDDALTAFIWQSVMRVRRPRFDPSIEISFARAVNVRSFLGIPEQYPGLVQNMTYHSFTLQKLLDEPLGGVAANLRAELIPDKLAYRTRALATLMHRMEDRSTISLTANHKSSSDLMLSSWVKVDCYGFDFGLGLGNPECVRRPQFMPVESLFYLMPKSPGGEISAALCLRHEDMDRLKLDEEFSKYSEYIG